MHKIHQKIFRNKNKCKSNRYWIFNVEQKIFEKKKFHESSNSKKNFQMIFVNVNCDKKKWRETSWRRTIEKNAKRFLIENLITIENRIELRSMIKSNLNQFDSNLYVKIINTNSIWIKIIQINASKMLISIFTSRKSLFFMRNCELISNCEIENSQISFCDIRNHAYIDFEHNINYQKLW